MAIWHRFSWIAYLAVLNTGFVSAYAVLVRPIVAIYGALDRFRF